MLSSKSSRSSRSAPRQAILQTPAYATGAVPKFKTAAGQEITLDGGTWKKLAADAIAAKQNSIELTAAGPLSFAAKESATFTHNATSITFRDGTVVQGKSVEDKMTLQVDKVDVRSSVDEDKSLAWHYLGAEWKKAFEEHSAEEAEGHKSFDKNDERYLRHVKQMEIHAPTVAEHNAKHGGAKHSAEAHAPAEGHAASGHSHYPEIVIDRKDVAFWSTLRPSGTPITRSTSP